MVCRAMDCSELLSKIRKDMPGSDSISIKLCTALSCESATLLGAYCFFAFFSALFVWDGGWGWGWVKLGKAREEDGRGTYPNLETKKKEKERKGWLGGHLPVGNF